MSYLTKYDGEVIVKSKKCKDMVKHYLLDDTENEYGDTLFESKLDYNLGILTIDEDRRNYEEEMEAIFDLIVYYDKDAKGEVLAEGEDGEGKERFILENGKVFREEGYIKYKNKKDITDKPDNLEEINELLDSIENDISCDKCNNKLNIKSFNFKTRGYYDEIIENTKFKLLCAKCYKNVKEPFALKRKLQYELKEQENKINELKDSSSIKQDEVIKC